MFDNHIKGGADPSRQGTELVHRRTPFNQADTAALLLKIIVTSLSLVYKQSHTCYTTRCSFNQACGKAVFSQVHLAKSQCPMKSTLWFGSYLEEEETSYYTIENA